MAFLRNIRCMRWCRRLILWGIGFTAVVLLLLVFANWQVKKCGQSVYDNPDNIPEREYGLLLGTVKMIGSYQNLFYTHRIQAAAELYHKGKVRKIIVSGDNGRKGYDEPGDMRQSLLEAGVPEENILCDYAGFRTLDSVVRAENVFGIREYTVISQGFHCERAIFIARKHGHNAIGYAAKDPQLTAKRLKVYVREVAARFIAWLDVMVLNRKPHFEK